MKRGFASNRRADEFDALLSGRTAGGRAPEGDYAELLAVVATLRAAPEVTARPEFVADLRERLVAEAAAGPVRTLDAATVARLTPRQRRGSRERRLAAVVGGFAVVAASGSMAMASQGALPGDVLYPVKRAIENAHTNLQSDEAARAGTLIDHAEARLAEVEALTRGDADGVTVAATLQDFTEQAGQAAELALDDYDRNGDERAIEELRAFTAGSMDRLTALGASLPVDARPALIAAAQTIRQADDAAFQACTSCGEAPITELPEFASQSLDPLLTGLDPSATAAPAPDFAEILQRVEAAEEELRIERPEQQPRQPRPELQAEPEVPEQAAPTEQPSQAPDLLEGLEQGVDGLLGGGKQGSSDQKTPGGGGGAKSGGVGGVVGGVVDGVTGLLGTLLP